MNLLELSYAELNSLVDLCEKNMDFLGTKKRINSDDREIRHDFDITSSLRLKLYDIINKRISAIYNDGKTV